MKDEYTTITPEIFAKFGQLTEVHHIVNTKGPWRVTVWQNGKAMAHKDFAFETLADSWAQKTRDAAKILKATGIFVKKEQRNGQ